MLDSMLGNNQVEGYTMHYVIKSCGSYPSAVLVVYVCGLCVAQKSAVCLSFSKELIFSATSICMPVKYPFSKSRGASLHALPVCVYTRPAKLILGTSEPRRLVSVAVVA